MIPRPAALVLLFVSLAACGTDGRGTEVTLHSGIRGSVQVGPQCPVEVEGSPCPDVPFHGFVSASDADGEVARAETDDDGTFEMPLPPGVYEVVAVIEDAGPPTAVPQTVTVEDDAFTNLTLEVDSGIR
jgi:hypothetical protein